LGCATWSAAAVMLSILPSIGTKRSAASKPRVAIHPSDCSLDWSHPARRKSGLIYPDQLGFLKSRLMVENEQPPKCDTQGSATRQRLKQQCQQRGRNDA